MNDVTAEKRKRETVKLPFDALDMHLKRLSLNDAEAGAAMGYSGAATVRGWREEGRAPKAAVLAAECLVRRIGPNAKEMPVKHPTVMIITLEDGDAAAYMELVMERSKGVKVIYKK